MIFSLRRWRPRHLLMSWLAYWIAALLVLLWPVIKAGYRFSQDPENHGSINVGFGDAGFTAKVANGGDTIFNGSMSLLALTLLLAGPPLLLWLAWFVKVSRTNNADNRALRATQSSPELHPGPPSKGIVDTSTQRRRAPEEA